MQHAPACRQSDPAASPDVTHTDAVTATSRRDFNLICDPAMQEISVSASRRIRRAKDFLAAAQFMVGAGFHPRAGRTTLLLAKVFAERMRRNGQGHFPFSAEATARELGLKRRTVYNHVRYLRELGLLVYVEHGSKRNVLRSRYGSAWTSTVGYRGTATLFAAVAPRVWDEAMGHRIDGEGYAARQIGVTDAGRELAVAKAAERQQERQTPQPTDPVDNFRSCTPSVVVPQPRTSSSVDGGIKDRTRERACQKTPRPHRSKGSTQWSPARTAAAMEEARGVQLQTWWAQGSCVRQLSFALRPFFEAGWTQEAIARELARWTVPLRPRHIASYIASEIRRRVNSGSLFLPDGLVAPYRQPETSTWDDGKTPHGPRYEAMQVFKASTYRPAAARAATALQEIRQALANRSGKHRLEPQRGRRVSGAHPENLRLTRQEIDALLAENRPVTACESLWADAEQSAERRIEAESRLDSWEYRSPASPELR
ncbi:helix-turn-helix domain-containing protein [Streptomyces sp. NPDC046994]|uniref:helix-turn-helix domain-containing protein n=1 Tax=Streptomyces sp. NPDC046994 TaxID=3155735 RepID=UPI00345388DE